MQAAGLPFEALRQEEERHYFCETLKMHAESLSSISGAPGKVVVTTDVLQGIQADFFESREPPVTVWRYWRSVGIANEGRVSRR